MTLRCPGARRLTWTVVALSVLPGAMRHNGIDMWITVMREGLLDPLWEALGRGYVGGWAYYVFFDPGEGRVERAVFGAEGYGLEACGVYDRFGVAGELAAYVRAGEISREIAERALYAERSGFTPPTAGFC